MNRFLIFFLISFIVHLSVGAILLARTGFFEGQKSQEGSADISDIGDFPSESEEPLVTDNSQTEIEAQNVPEESHTLINVSEAPPESTGTKTQPEPPSPSTSTKKRVQKNQPAKKLKKLLPNTPTKKPPSSPPVKKPSAPLPEKSPPSAQESKKPTKNPPAPPVLKPKESQPTAKSEEVGENSATKPLSQDIEDEEEWEDEDKILQEHNKDEEWEDEGEILIQKTNTQWVDEGEIIPESILQKASFQEEGHSNQSVSVPKPPPLSPGNIAGSSSIPALDIGQARKHSQLKQLKGNPLPIYPKEALKKKWEGRAEIFYYVNPAGFVEKIQLKSSSGHRVLDNSALRALARYRYHPGQEGWVRHPVEFFLELDKEIKKTATLRGGLESSAIQQTK